jgi:hypothetical protein
VLVVKGVSPRRCRGVLHPTRTGEVCVPGTYILSNKVVALILGAREGVVADGVAMAWLVW